MDQQTRDRIDELWFLYGRLPQKLEMLILKEAALKKGNKWVQIRAYKKEY